MPPEEQGKEAETTEGIETPQEEQKNVKRPVIDSKRPLANQVERMLEAVPEKEEETKEASDAPKEATAEQAAEKAVENVPESEDLELEDIPEETPKEPLPAWQQYVLDNLPVIRVIGHEGEDGNNKVFNVKRLEDLPDNFEFASKREELAFTQSLATQELNARDLLARYREEEMARSRKEFESLEAIDVQNDIRSLQRQKILPAFKYPENDRRFNEDDAVKLANEIYEFYQKTNQDYYTRYNGSGRMYRISYEDAAYRYFALHPDKANKPVEKEQPEPKKDKTPQQEQREKVAAKVSAPQGASGDGRQRPLPPGTSLNRIYQLYKNGTL